MFKKSLAAVAVLGAFAGSAFAAEVTMYGVIDTGLITRMKTLLTVTLLPILNSTRLASKVVSTPPTVSASRVQKSLVMA